MSAEPSSRTEDLLKLATNIVAAYVSNNTVPANELPAMIKSAQCNIALGGLSGSSSSDAGTTQKPAVNVKKSITPEYVICLEDGKKLKMLKRYLRSNYNMTPEEYRAKWGLPARLSDGGVPNYAEQRSQFAKKIGLRVAMHRHPRDAGAADDCAVEITLHRVKFSERSGAFAAPRPATLRAIHRQVPEC